MEVTDAVLELEVDSIVSSFVLEVVVVSRCVLVLVSDVKDVADVVVRASVSEVVAVASSEAACEQV